MKEQKTDIWDQRKKEYFSKRFSQLLKKWIQDEKSKGNKGTQEEFAKRIYSTPNSISKYKTGTDFPSQSSMNAICREFGVSEEYFFPIFDFERGADKTFHDEKNRRLNEYCDSIGLNKNLFYFITGEESLQKSFPVHSSRDSDSMLKRHPIVRTDSPFQITDENGNTHLLENSDLDYVKLLQTEIESFIRFKFYEERQALRVKEQERTINAITSHTDVTRDEILSRCTFKETGFLSPENAYQEDMKTIGKAFSQIQEERGERIVWHWKQSEIDEMFSFSVDPMIHKLNLYSGMTEEELQAFYKDCEIEESIRKQEYIKELLKNGDVIENG